MESRTGKVVAFDSGDGAIILLRAGLWLHGSLQLLVKGAPLPPGSAPRLVMVLWNSPQITARLAADPLYEQRAHAAHGRLRPGSSLVDLPNMDLTRGWPPKAFRGVPASARDEIKHQVAVRLGISHCGTKERHAVGTVVWSSWVVDDGPAVLYRAVVTQVSGAIVTVKFDADGLSVEYAMSDITLYTQADCDRAHESLGRSGLGTVQLGDPAVPPPAPEHQHPDGFTAGTSAA